MKDDHTQLVLDVALATGARGADLADHAGLEVRELHGAEHRLGGDLTVAAAEREQRRQWLREQLWWYRWPFWLNPCAKARPGSGPIEGLR